MQIAIMAGGSGTRFWPASRKKFPKQFLSIAGESPLMNETYNRVKGLTTDDKIMFLTGQRYVTETERLFKNRSVQIVAEPVGRNTAPCIGLGAIYSKFLGNQDPIVYLPADHYIFDQEKFLATIKDAYQLAKKGRIITIGIVPSKPETGYGYIKRSDDSISARANKAYRVSSFVEKPDFETACEYLSAGSYYWNAGIFVATAETILNEISLHLPDMHARLMTLLDEFGADNFEDIFADVYGRIESISFDYGIMEKTTCEVLVIPCDCGWSDVGSWESVYELKDDLHDANGNLADCEALFVESSNNYVSGQQGRLIACLGLNDCLVVDTDDAILVADLKRSQEVKKIVDLLSQTNRKNYL